MAEFHCDIVNTAYRHWSFVLYPREDPTHVQALNYIRENFSYAEIEHCYDVKEDGSGELKKPHTHVVVSFQNAVYARTLEKKLGIRVIDKNVSKFQKKALLYLLHFGEIDKHGYNLEDVQGDLKYKLQGYLISADRSFESASVLDIITFINESGYLPLSQLVEFVCKNFMYDIYRRSQMTFIKLLDEHNKCQSCKPKI